MLQQAIVLRLCLIIHLLPQLAKLEKEVKEHAKKVTIKEEAEAEVPIINPGIGGKLLLTQGP